MKKILDIIIGILSKLFPKPVPIVIEPAPIPKPEPEPLPIAPILPKKTPGQILYETAVLCLGIDVSPNDIAPDELGCMETVDNVYKKAFGTYINGSNLSPLLSTYLGYIEMLGSKRFLLVTDPQPGDIIISPTGYGNGRLSNGHVGIISKYGIFSNSSATGKFEQNFTLDNWMKYYQWKGGYPVKFFRPK